MNALRFKLVRRERRKRRVRRKVLGTPDRPRLSVFRSNRQIYAQLIDDTQGRTLCAAGSRDRDISADVKHGGNKEAALVVGRALAARARMHGIKRVAFDRSGYRYHGRVKALADAAREAGLEF
jgi:large subunit ribosomal protein L18